MELTLARQAGTQVLVTCGDRTSHTLDLLTLIPGKNGLSHPLADPVAYGKAIYQALFPPETAAWSALNANPDRILFVSTDDTIDAIPWEYAYGTDDFVVLECHFVRGLPADQRIESPALDKGLHIVAVPSNPLSHGLESLNIDGEWIRLKEIIQELQEFAITVERTRPPTLERIGLLVTGQQQRIVHFMGHGGQDEKAGANPCFEKDNGDLDAVTARDFMRQLRGNVFLVTLNACISAAPGETHLSNLAAALVRQKTPYALGMRFSIPDEDALAFSRTFYSYLARGSSVEEAVSRVRLTLSRNRQRQWMIGVPVLYTSLSAPATGFASIPGTPEIKEHQPPIEASALPRAEGAFQGRIDELKQLGSYLTGDNRPRLVTIHGSGGQGKTALAREAVERFAYAWPGGVWATSLENLPGREVFVNDLARFLGIATQEIHDPAEIERQVLRQLNQHRTLIVLDNTETLIEAVRADNAGVTQLSQFIQQLPSPTVSLLVTSREHLGWSGEVAQEIGGLSSEEGANLFRWSAPQRANEVEMALAEELSQKLKGHPLSLRLLGGAFNASSIALQTFFEDCDTQLLKAENKYVGEEHPHRTLYASIDTSVRYLDAELAHLFSKLWLFHAPFLPATATAIFDPQIENAEDKRSPIYDRLHTLWQRSLLTLETATLREGTVQLYRVLPTIRPYIEKYLAQVNEREGLLARFGEAYAHEVRYLHDELDRGGVTAFIAFQSREDLERGASCVTGVAQGYYLRYWGWILQRLGDTRRGMKLIEQALGIGQGQDRQLELQALNIMALLYYATGQPQRALELYEQALPLMREVGDRAGEATILNNMAGVYKATGQPQRALELNEQSLPITREMGDRAGEATTLNNIAEVYRTTGQPQRALELYEQTLPLMREMGNRAMEAATLNNIAVAYQDTGKSQDALKLYEQALPIRREVGDRAGEATTLNNMAGVYDATGQPQRALELYEQALPLMREVGDRAGEATILNNIAEVYNATGQPQRALELYEQALPIHRVVGNRAGEATTLNGLALVYRTTGQPQRALELFEQALPLMREVGDRAGEATTLNGLALVYNATGQPQRALELYEQALPLMREVGDRAGEAATLNNIGVVYRTTGQPKRALELYEQALPLMREVGDRAGEATTLNNIAEVYRTTGQPQRALELFEQALPIHREVGNRAMEATTLNGLAAVYDATGQPRRALELYEQALPIRREVAGRAGEATILNNMAMVYNAMGQPQRALELCEQALPLMREVGNRAGEATTLNNMAGVYLEMGQPQRALEMFEQALPIHREVGNRAMEATTLNNMAGVYDATGQPQRALEMFEQALPIRREVGDRAGEATTLTNMAGVYLEMGQPQRALELYEQALPLMREVGNRAGEATILNNIAVVYLEMGQSQRALELYEQALPLMREVGNRAGEATTLANIADVLYKYLNRSQEAITRMEQAIAVLVETGLPQEAARQTRDDMQHYLDAMRQGIAPGQAIGGSAAIPATRLQVIVTNTVAVMTTMQERRSEWRTIIADELQHAKQEGDDWQIEVEFFSAVLALLDEQSPALPGDHPYASALAKIQEGIAEGSLPDTFKMRERARRKREAKRRANRPRKPEE